FCQCYEILYPAVGSLGELELDGKVKSTKLLRSHNITAIGGFPSIGWQYGDDTIFDFPSIGGECIYICTNPTRITVSVKEQFVSALRLISREAVWCEVYRIDALREILRLQVFRLYPYVLEIYLFARQSGIADTVYLQSDESRGIKGIHHIGNWDT